MLSEKDYIQAAQELNCEVAFIKAVAKAESDGDGFLSDGSPKILFEGHKFWEQLKAKGINPYEHVQGNETILYKSWTTDYYKGGKGEYERLEQAFEIDKEAALRSASWGKFQIMGYHAESLGYQDVFDFVAIMDISEQEHLKAFVKFIKVNNIQPYMEKADPYGFARRYNGSGQVNYYGNRIKKFYEDFKRH